MERTLLLVEDDPDTAALFQIVFRRLESKLNLIRVSDGLEALQYLMNHPAPALIVTDLQMPRMTGHELLSWVRANPTEARVPVLVLSAQSESDLENKLLEQGADAYICKFSSLNDLKQSLRRHCEPRHGNETAQALH